MSQPGLFILSFLMCVSFIVIGQTTDIHSTEVGKPEDEFFSNTYSKIDRLIADSNFRRAILLQDEIIRYIDSIVLSDKKNTIKELESRFEDSQQKNEIALATAKYESQVLQMEQQALQQYIYMGGGIAMVLVIIGLLSRLNYFRKVQDELKEKGMKIALEKMRAEESERVREQFLAKMSHEIRTPMNAIMGMGGILKKQKHYKNQEKFLDAIKQSSENLLVILNDILDLSRLEAGNIQIEKVPFKPVTELMKLSDILKYKAEDKGILLRCELDNELPEVLIGDPVRLSQVLINLTGNAIKFTDIGTVDVKIRLKEKVDESIILEVKIIDTGIGIPDDRLEKIFESFIQAESNTSVKYGGTGLGLTISKEFIELQNGNIKVESKQGKGSIFTLELPYKIGSLSDISDRVVEISDVPLSGLKVLLVEDNDFNVLVAKTELNEIIHNPKIDIARNGLEAIEKVDQFDYDIVLMDIEMELMNGYEAAKKIRMLDSPKCELPIIAITANAMVQEIRECYNAGMNDHLSKPFNPNDLKLKIQKLLYKSTLS